MNATVLAKAVHKFWIIVSLDLRWAKRRSTPFVSIGRGGIPLAPPFAR